MQQISISDIQRNLHKLDGFDIVEIIDKKRNQVKGYFIDNKYAGFVQELFENQLNINKTTKSLGGSLSKYANTSLLEKEDDAWKEHVAQKHKQ